MKTLDTNDFDVIVLGTGMGGSIMGSILGKHGKRVLMLDEGVHPRFAIGESTIPQTSQMIQLLARDHGIPELSVLGLKSPSAIRKEITSACGIKRIFGFVYHELGHEHDPKLAHQFGNVWRDENHLFRQDIDAWLLTVAMKYGCCVRQGMGVDAVDIDDSGVRVATRDGSRYTAKFIVDGTGYRSVLAEKFGLREQPCPMVSSTRSLFTHMIGVKDFEQAAPSNMSHPWSVGTLHHLFERGWFWVIPFNNWEGATNPLVSVGLTLDDRAHPEDPNLGPEEEFAKFLELLPSVGRQFAEARAVRPWIRSKRIQYSSRRTVGERWALLSHAAGFVDPLFSRGLINTMENIHALADALLPALEDGDFSEERFAAVDAQQKSAFSFADRMVRAAYASWDDFELWNLWIRVWAIAVHAAESNLGSVLVMGKYSNFEPVDDPVFSFYEPAGYRSYFEASYAAMVDFDEGRESAETTRHRLRRILDEYDFEIPLRDGSKGHEWAMKHPLCRDIFLGLKENHERWMAASPDPHLADP